MSTKYVPFFELDGNKYYFNRNRFLLAEFNRIKEENSVSEEDEGDYVILQDKYSRLEKIARRYKELEDAYFETFSDEARELYERAKEHYEKTLKDVTEYEKETEGLSQRVQKQSVDNMEELIIIALQKDEKGNTIRTPEEANDIWCSYVDLVGKQVATEWLVFAVNYIIGNNGEEEENPFVAQEKAKAERRANMRKGFNKVK